jgi:hypothetical protein
MKKPIQNTKKVQKKKKSALLLFMLHLLVAIAATTTTDQQPDDQEEQAERNKKPEIDRQSNIHHLKTSLQFGVLCSKLLLSSVLEAIIS